jgi:hypothetical protein
MLMPDYALQAEYRKLQAMYEKLKGQKIMELEGLAEEQDDYICKMGAVSASTFFIMIVHSRCLQYIVTGVLGLCRLCRQVILPILMFSSQPVLRLNWWRIAFYLAAFSLQLRL